MRTLYDVVNLPNTTGNKYDNKILEEAGKHEKADGNDMFACILWANGSRDDNVKTILEQLYYKIKGY